MDQSTSHLNSSACTASRWSSGVLQYSSVIENAMDPDSPHLAHWAVGKNSRVFDWNISLVIEAIGHPAAQCFRRKPPFVHGDVEWMFVVICARADCAQIFHERFAVPNPGGHKMISTSHLIMSF